MKYYRCKKSFPVGGFDEYGKWTGESMKVAKNSEWVVEEGYRIIEDDIRLSSLIDNTSICIEITEETLRDYFSPMKK